jgi:coenzyme PQQ precursor peptide PqqA
MRSAGDSAANLVIGGGVREEGPHLPDAGENKYHFRPRGELMDKQETWSRPDFEETSSGFEVTAYVNDWDQDRL